MDESLLHLINEQWTSPLLDLFMAALERCRNLETVVCRSWISALLFGGFKARAFVICLLLVLANRRTRLRVH